MIPNWSALLTLENLKFVVSALTLLIASIGGSVAYSSFRRTERWKRAEFLADKMKSFFDDECVQKTKMLIDWGGRRIQLLPAKEPQDGKVKVTRSMQARALRPHTINPNVFVEEDEDFVEQVGTDALQHYTATEEAIRDCYDRFLDGLETLASYAKANLIDLDSMKPYILYWIEDMQSTSGSSSDAAWRASLLTYITFYRYSNVLWLFKAFRFDIGVKSATYHKLLSRMENKRFADALAHSVEPFYIHTHDKTNKKS